MDATLKGVMVNELEALGLKSHPAFNEVRHSYSGDLTRAWVTTDVEPLYNLLNHISIGRSPSLGYGLVRSYLKARQGLITLTHRNGMYGARVYADSRFFDKEEETDLMIGYIHLRQYGLLPALGIYAADVQPNKILFKESDIQRGPVYYYVLLPQSFSRTIAPITLYDLQLIKRFDKSEEYDLYTHDLLETMATQPSPTLSFYSPAKDFNSYWHWRTPPLTQLVRSWYEHYQGRRWTIHDKVTSYPVTY